MTLTTQKQIKEINIQLLLQDALVRVSGYFYAVDFGPGVCPNSHRVGKDKRCTCGLGANCPAVSAVADYLRKGGERAPDPPPGFYPVAPQACPICGAGTYYVPDLTSKHRGVGWACVHGHEAHYWLAHVNSLRQQVAENPWIYPPVYAPDGKVLYPGLRRDELVTESRPWPEGYDPNC